MDDGQCPSTQQCQAPNGQMGVQCGKYCINTDILMCERQWMAGLDRCVVKEKPVAPINNPSI